MTVTVLSPSTTPVSTFADPTLVRRARRAAIVFGLVGIACLLTTVLLYFNETVGAICNDGWSSSSTGRGTCSSHDGIDEYTRVRTFFGLSEGSRFNVPRSAFATAGLVSVGLATVLARYALHRRTPTIDATSVARASTKVARGTSPAASAIAHDARLASGVMELTAKVTSGGAGRTVSITGADGSSTVSPFFFEDEPDRAGPTLAALLRKSKRRMAREERGAVETYGGRLFDALFPEPAHSIYRRELATAVQNDTRLRIVLDLDEQTADRPWEYLFDSERASFLAMSNDTSVVRMISDGSPTRPIEPVEQLRVLVMSASPSDLDALDVDAEVNRIEKRLQTLKDRALVRPVHGQTIEDLRLALNDFAPHVFHFVGHGTWDAELDDGALAFANSAGLHEPATGRDLGLLLVRSGLRLVLLNSCDGARTSRHDRFAGVASSLVAQGVPAAIGMQYAIEDDAAAAFGSEFLGALVSTQSIDAALTSARTAVYTARSAVEWGTPVFTTRVPVDEIIRWDSGPVLGD